MTREKAKRIIEVLEHIEQIFNDHESQLKAKDEEIYWAKVLRLKELCKEVEIDDLLKALSYEQIENISEYFKLLKDNK